ncbi:MULTISPECIES: DUF397 domain-containing protein [Streptomyces]|uniref:DUF397 domain-containing protein n=1 Tax=Streptomyces koelreuteriae TaxID=2838015 RepID=A0ABX8FXH8_9ACTN|nr:MULTISPECIES: DUF397 domain-containing protein [Streptomyces]QWB25925.1 DUF397 domain-containing protein [Streptomyces koelreuteriae]UUA08988.1 DUF397 domain-containing protein [Streptomyces koelreuteriae]UUA16593.1 DUF397 domain-containing protein [Streptomyces sp. CRCS-T-1]
MASNAIPTGIRWRKSSYSGDQGGNCVECAPIGALAWRASTYSSDQGGNCIEIAETPHTTIAIRDSKNPAGPILTLDPAAFTTFVNWTTTDGDYSL